MQMPAARSDTRLRYRFADLAQARAHLHPAGRSSLFFYRDDTVRFFPDAPVCLSFSFEDGDTTRLLHGRALDHLEGSGTWIKLDDTRALENFGRSAPARRWPRTGCDVEVGAWITGGIRAGRMLDLGLGGARIRGLEGVRRDQRLELRLLSPDRLTFRDLSYAFVAWVNEREIGVRFDDKDSVGKSAVTRLYAETEAHWAKAPEVCHPAFCCGPKGLKDPPRPRKLDASEEVTGRIA